MTIRTIRTLAEFEQSSAQYRALVAATPSVGPYLTHRWVASTWAARGERADRKVFVVEQDGSWQVALPMGLTRARYKRIPVSIVGLLAERWGGTGLPQRDVAAPWADEFLAWVRREYGRRAIVRLPYFATGESSFLEATREGRHVGHTVMANPYIPLGTSWETFLAARSRNFRRTIKRKMAAIAEHPEVVEIEHVRNPDADVLADTVAEVSRSSWQGRDRVAVAGGDEGRRFYRALATSSGDFDIDLMRLSIEGRRAGYLVAFRHGGRSYAYDTGFDPAIGELSPGLVLHFRLLELLCAEGCTELDLGPPAPYKERFDASVRELRTAQLLPSIWLRLYDRVTDRILPHRVAPASSDAAKSAAPTEA